MRFAPPKLRKGNKVSTKQGEGVIESIDERSGNYWYTVTTSNGRAVYAEFEIKLLP